MNLRQMAERDLQITLEDAVNGSAVSVKFIEPTGTQHQVNANIGDIGYLIDTDGNAIAGRCVTAAWRLSSLVNSNGQQMEPGRGWKVSYSDLAGREWTLFVTRFEPDRTIGVGRVFLSLDLS